jgi:hypothetical protein
MFDHLKAFFCGEKGLLLRNEIIPSVSIRDLYQVSGLSQGRHVL